MQHYKSFAMLRLLYLRHNPLATAGVPPRMQVVGLEKRGWAAARSTLLQLCSPYYVSHAKEHAVSNMLGMHMQGSSILDPLLPSACNEALRSAALLHWPPTALPQMLRCDSLRVKRYLEECAAAEASQAQEAAPASTTVTDGNGVAAVALPLKALGAGEQGGSECGEFAKAAVLPWWLSPEQIPDAYSGERIQHLSTSIDPLRCAANCRGCAHYKAMLAAEGCAATAAAADLLRVLRQLVSLLPAFLHPSACVCSGAWLDWRRARQDQPPEPQACADSQRRWPARLGVC